MIIFYILLRAESKKITLITCKNYIGTKQYVHILLIRKSSNRPMIINSESC